MHSLAPCSTAIWAAINEFDALVIHFINSYAQHSLALDSFIEVIGDSNLLKGGLCMALFIWAWFTDEPGHAERQQYLMFAFISSTAALILGRLISLCLPMRVRPMHNPMLHFRVPFGVTEDPHSWNSMPSDHAILFCCLAMSLCFVSRRLGLIAWAQAIFVVCLPRAYMGYHYPTDLLAGALIGTAVALVAKWGVLRQSVANVGFDWLAQSPASFYAFCFVWFFEVSELFTSPLMFLGYARKTFGHLLLARL